MENKKTTPVLTVIFYLLGIIFLVISAFMLYVGITYMRTYMATYDMEFTDTWSNSIQYVIEKFVPYFGFGVISLGVGKAIKEARNSAIAEVKVPEIKVPEINVPDAKVPDTLAKSEDVDKAVNGAIAKIEEVAKNLEEFKVISDIKLEEMEKRQSFRLKESRDIINGELVEHMASRAAAEDLIIRLLGSSTDEMKDISEFRKDIELPEGEDGDDVETADNVETIDVETIETAEASDAADAVEAADAIETVEEAADAETIETAEDTEAVDSVEVADAVETAEEADDAVEITEEVEEDAATEDAPAEDMPAEEAAVAEDEMVEENASAGEESDAEEDLPAGEEPVAEDAPAGEDTADEAVSAAGEDSEEAAATVDADESDDEDDDEIRLPRRRVRRFVK